MTTKESAIRAIQDLPEEASWDEVQERIRFVADIQRGIEELDKGLGIQHEDLKRETREWTGE